MRIQDMGEKFEILFGIISQCLKMNLIRISRTQATYQTSHLFQCSFHKNEFRSLTFWISFVISPDMKCLLAVY